MPLLKDMLTDPNNGDFDALGFPLLHDQHVVHVGSSRLNHFLALIVYYSYFRSDHWGIIKMNDRNLTVAVSSGNWRLDLLLCYDRMPLS